MTAAESSVDGGWIRNSKSSFDVPAPISEASVARPETSSSIESLEWE